MKSIIFFLLLLLSNPIALIGQAVFHKVLPSKEEHWQSIFCSDKNLVFTNGIERGTSMVYDNILQKSDSLGSSIWKKKYNKSYGTSLVELDNLELVLVGSYAGRSNDKSFLLKVNFTGVPIWYKQFTRGSSFFKVLPLNSKQLLIGGSWWNGNNVDLLLVKADSTGSQLWTKTYGSSGLEMESANFNLKSGKDGGFFLISSTAGFGEGFVSGYLVKTDQDGNVEWSKTYGSIGGTTKEHLYDLLELEDCYYILAGGNSFSVSGMPDVYLMKTDKLGNLIWAKSYGGNDNDGIVYFSNLLLSPDSGLIFSGVTRSFGHGNTDAILFKTDFEGNLIWSKCYGGPGADATFIHTLDRQNDALVSISSSQGVGVTPWAPYMIRMDLNGRSGCNEMDVTDQVQVNDITSQMVVTSPNTLVGVPAGTLYDTTISYIDVPSEITTLCYCDVQAGFTFSIKDSSIQFSNTSINFSSLSWDFGNGQTSTEINPAQTFISDSTYTITLSAFTNNSDCWDTVKVIIKIPKYVPPPPVPELIISNLISVSDQSGFVIDNLQPGTGLIIYDALGRLIFASSNYQNNWGLGASSGLYIYQLILPDGEKRKGRVVVVR